MGITDLNMNILSGWTVNTRKTTCILCKVILIAVALAPLAAKATDLATFCLSAKPADTQSANNFDAICPIWLQAQGISAQQALSTTALTQQYTQAQTNTQQAQVLTALAGLSKQGPPPVPTGQGFDLSGLAGDAQLQDALMMYVTAQKISAILEEELKPAAEKSVCTNKATGCAALFVTASNLAAMNANQIDSTIVEKSLNKMIEQVNAVACKDTGQVHGLDFTPALVSILGVQALLNAVSGTAALFQPSLLAASKVPPVVDPTQLIAAGLATGLSSGGKARILFRVPNVGADNEVVTALDTLRNAIVAANKKLAACEEPAKDSKLALFLKGQVSVVADANALIVNLLKTDGTKPSLLDSAAKKKELNKAGVEYTIYISPQVEAGGIAAIKPNAFQSVRLAEGTSVALSYQLTNFNGVTRDAALAKCSRRTIRTLDEWQKQSNGASSDIDIAFDKPKSNQGVWTCSVK
jgi:hypothetical protein